MAVSISVLIKYKCKWTLEALFGFPLFGLLLVMLTLAVTQIYQKSFLMCIEWAMG
jgi:hypothetical protein